MRVINAFLERIKNTKALSGKVKKFIIDNKIKDAKLNLVNLNRRASMKDEYISDMINDVAIKKWKNAKKLDKKINNSILGYLK